MAGIIGYAPYSAVGVKYCVNTTFVDYAICSSMNPRFTSCYTTVSCTCNQENCTIEPDLTSSDMQNLYDPDSYVSLWRTNDDGTLDLNIY